MIDISQKDRERKLHELIELTYELRNSEEFQVYKDLLKIRFGFSICRINFFNLKREISLYYKKVPHLHDKSTSSRSRFQARITTQIYNSITSARSFVEYNYKNHEFLDTEISCFIKEFRNYIAHSEPFILTSHVKYIHIGPNERTESFDFNGFRNELIRDIKTRKNKTHKEKALEFIKTNGKNNRIYLNELMNEYFQSIVSIYRDCLFDHILDNKVALERLIEKSKIVWTGMHQIKYSSTAIPLDEIKIRYLEFVLDTANSPLSNR